MLEISEFGILSYLEFQNYTYDPNLLCISLIFHNVPTPPRRWDTISFLLDLWMQRPNIDRQLWSLEFHRPCRVLPWTTKIWIGFNLNKKLCHELYFVRHEESFVRLKNSRIRDSCPVFRVVIEFIPSQIPTPTLICRADETVISNAVKRGFKSCNADHCMCAALTRWPVYLPNVEAFSKANFATYTWRSCKLKTKTTFKCFETYNQCFVLPDAYGMSIYHLLWRKHSGCDHRRSMSAWSAPHVPLEACRGEHLVWPDEWKNWLALGEWLVCVALIDGHVWQILHHLKFFGPYSCH